MIKNALKELHRSLKETVVSGTISLELSTYGIIIIIVISSLLSAWITLW